MKYFIISILTFFSFFHELSEPKITFNGEVKDKSTSETISQCKVTARNNKSGITFETLTDKDGKFSIFLTSGNYSFEYNKTDYVLNKSTITLKAKKDTTYNTTVFLTSKAPKKEVKKVLRTEKLAKSAPKKSRGATKYIEGVTMKEVSESYSGAATRGEMSYSASYDDLGDDRTKYVSSDVPTDLKAGTLTAGEINDFSKWVLWNDLSAGDLKNYATSWMILPKHRFCVLVTSQNKNPLNDITVVLKNKENEIIWQCKTDNTGKAELWADLFDSATVLKNNYKIEAIFDNRTYTSSTANIFENGINNIVIKTSCSRKNNVDIVFAVDATGSMGDEIRYLQTELYDVIEKIKSNNAELDLRMGSVFYRDKTDDYLTVEQDLTSDINKVIDFIKAQSANGGGDEPEAVDAALEKAIGKFDWSKEARTRIVFLVLDASPHTDADVVERIHKYTKLAAELGIRIVPVVCSGIDKSGEYLMRSIALATNGNYVFLTDNSGVGNPHIAPSTDKFDVETLNNLLVRLIQQYIFVPECNNTVNSTLIDSLQKNKPDSISKDTSFVNSSSIIADSVAKAQNNFLKYYPNPCRDILYVECSGITSDLYIADINGKIIMKVKIEKGEKFIKIDLSQYPAGIYFLKYCLENKCKAGKFVLIH